MRSSADMEQPCKMVVGRPMVHAYSSRDQFWYTTPSYETMYLVQSARFLPVLCEKIERQPRPAGFKWRIVKTQNGAWLARYVKIKDKETEHA